MTQTDRVIMTVPIIAAESPAHHTPAVPGSIGELNQKTNAKTNDNIPMINKTQAPIDARALNLSGIFLPPIK
jgi:hypothetical protein